MDLGTGISLVISFGALVAVIVGLKPSFKSLTTYQDSILAEKTLEAVIQTRRRIRKYENALRLIRLPKAIMCLTDDRQYKPLANKDVFQMKYHQWNLTRDAWSDLEDQLELLSFYTNNRFTELERDCRMLMIDIENDIREYNNYFVEGMHTTEQTKKEIESKLFSYVADDLSEKIDQRVNALVDAVTAASIIPLRPLSSDKNWFRQWLHSRSKAGRALQSEQAERRELPK